MPKPLWTSVTPDRERWVPFFWIGVFGLLVLALVGGDRHQETGWLLAWMVVTASLAAGVFGKLRARRMKHALPFAQGIYVFATDVVIAEDGKCYLQSFDSLKHVRLRPATGAGGAQETQIEWQFPGETVLLRVPSQQIAQRLLEQLQAMHGRLSDAMAESNWDNVHSLDPLYEARYGGAWERVCPPVTLPGARGENGWFGLPVPVMRAGLITGLAAGAALFFGSNLLRDSIAFQSAQSTNTPAAWRRFLQRPDSMYHAEARRRKLPAAALRAAQKEGTAQALRQVVNDFPNSPAAEEARAALARIYSDEERKALAEVDAQARPALQGLLRWLREHGTSEVEVRFGESSQAWLGTVDDFLKRVLRSKNQRVVIAPAAASFSPAVVHRREDATVAMLQQGFGTVASPDVVSLRKGPGYSGDPMGFNKPALAIQVVVDPLDGALTDASGERVYLKLGFDFKVSLTTPGVPTWSFSLPVSPADLLDPTQSGSLYDRMADIAYQELQQKIAENFFPHHSPERTIKVATNRARLVTSARPASGTRVSATGFFVSTNGYLVTARHVTRDAENLKVMTDSGPLDTKLVREDPKNDLALLKVEGSFKALPIRPSDTVKRLDRVKTYGFPQIDILGKGMKATDGTINGLDGMGDDQHFFQINLNVTHGNSGGPLLDERGNVIGVIIKGLDASIAQNVNYAIKSNELLALLAKFPELKLLPAMTRESPDMTDIIEKATVRLEGDGK